MATRYVIRTVDEDWIDLFDPPAHIDDECAAFEEARRRVGAHPACTTRIIDRYTGATIWRSGPDLLPRFGAVAVEDTVLRAGDEPAPPG